MGPALRESLPCAFSLPWAIQEVTTAKEEIVFHQLLTWALIEMDKLYVLLYSLRMKSTNLLHRHTYTHAHTHMHSKTAQYCTHHKTHITHHTIQNTHFKMATGIQQMCPQHIFTNSHDTNCYLFLHLNTTKGNGHKVLAGEGEQGVIGSKVSYRFSQASAGPFSDSFTKLLTTNVTRRAVAFVCSFPEQTRQQEATE